MQTAIPTASPVCEQATREAIGLALRADVQLKNPVRSRYDSPNSLLRHAAILIGLAVLLRFVPGLNTFSLGTFVTVVVVVGIAIILSLRAIKMRSRRAASDAEFAASASVIHEVPTQDYRVWCVGKREELQSVCPRAIASSDGFEPVIYPIWTPARGWLFVATSFAIAAASTAALYAVLTIGLAQNIPGLWLLVFGGSCGPVVTAWLFRRYTRITPGAVEVLNIGFLGIGRAPLERVELREARVVADLTQRCVFVIQPDGTHATIELVDDECRIEIVRDILRAAVCTAPVPRLPEDALVG